MEWIVVLLLIIAVIVSGCSKKEEEKPDNPIPENAYLSVKYQRYGGSNWCLPACVSMVLDYFGHNVSQYKLSKAILKISGLGDVYKAITYIKTYNLWASFQADKIEEIEGHINNKILVIVVQKYKLTNDLEHARVVAGYDKKKKVFITHDPSIREGYEITYEDFKKLSLINNNNYNYTLTVGRL